MKAYLTPLIVLTCSLCLLSACASVPFSEESVLANPLQQDKMSFFVTSQGLDGGNLGGLMGADAHCQRLATAAGASAKIWKAYLSTTTENAHDRIGTGPWKNARGVVIAQDLSALHNDASNLISKMTALNEKGKWVTGRGDSPNIHDILTGSTPDGKHINGQSCGDWSQTSTGMAMVGHHDRIGLGFGPSTQSWNSAHASLGCRQDQLKTTGGAGLFYCFAADAPLQQ